MPYSALHRNIPRAPVGQMHIQQGGGLIAHSKANNCHTQPHHCTAASSSSQRGGGGQGCVALTLVGEHPSVEAAAESDTVATAERKRSCLPLVCGLGLLGAVCGLAMFQPLLDSWGGSSQHAAQPSGRLSVLQPARQKWQPSNQTIARFRQRWGSAGGRSQRKRGQPRVLSGHSERQFDSFTLVEPEICHFSNSFFFFS